MLRYHDPLNHFRGPAPNLGFILGSAVLVICCAADAYAQDDAPARDAQPSTSAAQLDELNGLYTGIERIREAARRDVPLTTRFELNGRTIDSQSRPTGQLGVLYGDKRRNEPIANVLVPFKTKVESAIENGVGVRRQTGWYVGAQAVDSSRTVEWRSQMPVELIGFDLDLSVTGGCIFPGSSAEDFCTFTPGLTVGEEDIDPNTLTPGRFRFDSSFGEQISPETHQALKDAPGFVRGDPALDERVGISLKVPNAGQVLDASRRSVSGIDREERAKRRAMLTVSRVEQTLRSNDTQASLDHTTRGFVLLERDEWDAYSIVAQLSAWLLPGMDGELQSVAGEVPNTDISNNLFLAANNLRLPTDGFTMFRTGVGHVTHPETAPRNSDETPAVFYNNVWLGVSPVRSVSQSTTTKFRTTGDREFESRQFRQGGTGALFDDFAGRVTLVDEIANDIISLDLESIDDQFVQTGIGISRQDAVAEQITRQRSKFEYVPHLSFTGNRTDGRSVLRYYGGVIDPEDANFYVGTDGTYQFDNGFRISGSAIYYTQPDFDYFSKIELSGARSFEAGDGAIMTLGISGEMQFDRPSIIPESPNAGDQDDRIDVFAQYQAGWGRLTGRVRASGLRDGESESSATIGAAFPMSERSQVSFQVTPVSNESAYVMGRLGVSVPLGTDSGSPVFRAQYARLKYDFGNDPFGQGQSVTEDTLSAAVQFEF